MGSCWYAKQYDGAHYVPSFNISGLPCRGAVRPDACRPRSTEAYRWCTTTTKSKRVASTGRVRRQTIQSLILFDPIVAGLEA